MTCLVVSTQCIWVWPIYRHCKKERKWCSFFLSVLAYVTNVSWKNSARRYNLFCDPRCQLSSHSATSYSTLHVRSIVFCHSHSPLRSRSFSFHSAPFCAPLTCSALLRSCVTRTTGCAGAERWAGVGGRKRLNGREAIEKHAYGSRLEITRPS